MNQDFVFIDEYVRGIRWDAKYATWDNFTGKPVTGYYANRIAGTRALCEGIARAQKKAAALGYGLLLWDGYRPKRAVECFLKWSGQPESGSTKQKFYPNISKPEIINQGYVAEKSGHSRGGAVDLTLYRLDDGELLPMGGQFDFMDTSSRHGAKGIGKPEAGNREALRRVMEDSGFCAYQNEWWHYSLQREPYPDTYFDFPVI